MTRVRDENEPAPSAALNLQNADNWGPSMKTEIIGLRNMSYGEIIDARTLEKVVQLKTILRHERDRNRKVKKYNARFVVIAKEKDENVDENLFPVPDFTVIKLTIFLLCNKNNSASILISIMLFAMGTLTNSYMYTVGKKLLQTLRTWKRSLNYGAAFMA